MMTSNKNDVSGSRHRTESREALNGGISIGRDVSQSLVVGNTTTICLE